jgi:transposase
MNYLGLTPSDYASGERRRQGGITKASNMHARRALVAGAWAYRYPSKVDRHLQLRLEKLPNGLQDIRGQTQVRLCIRYRPREARGTHAKQGVVAVARDLAAFMWAIAQQVSVPPLRLAHVLDRRAPQEV